MKSKDKGYYNLQDKTTRQGVVLPKKLPFVSQRRFWRTTHEEWNQTGAIVAVFNQ